MENRQIVNTNKQVVDFISLEEASQQLGITYGQLVKWLNRNKALKEKYCFKAKYNGRKRTLIYIEAILVIANVKDTDRGNQSKIAPSATFQEGKQKLAESAIERVKMSKDLEALYENAMRIRDLVDNQIKTFESIYQIEGKVEDHEERLLKLEGDTESLPMTTGQRERLNERLRFFCSQTEIAHALVWRDLHDITGRKSINEYVFADYKIALSRLRDNYKFKGLKW